MWRVHKSVVGRIGTGWCVDEVVDIVFVLKHEFCLTGRCVCFWVYMYMYVVHVMYVNTGIHVPVYIYHTCMYVCTVHVVLGVERTAQLHVTVMFVYQQLNSINRSH